MFYGGYFYEEVENNPAFQYGTQSISIRQLKIFIFRFSIHFSISKPSLDQVTTIFIEAVCFVWFHGSDFRPAGLHCCCRLWAESIMAITLPVVVFCFFFYARTLHYHIDHHISTPIKYPTITWFQGPTKLLIFGRGHSIGVTSIGATCIETISMVQHPLEWHPLGQLFRKLVTRGKGIVGGASWCVWATFFMHVWC